jgi:DNA invertase Pin-like site-specific DNA recombinase
MTQFIAYFRVSTDRQGKSGLGLDAQREAVTRYVADRGNIAEEFTEIESGKKNNRPQLAFALAACRKRRAVLVIACLDRLARKVHFISGLMESGVEFVAVDMPHADKFMLHIRAAVAENEGELISRRTRAALAAAKQRGTKLGNPNPSPALALANQARQEEANRFADTLRPLIEKLQAEKLSLRGIAAELNRRSMPTARGKQWQAQQVANVLDRAAS